MMKAIRSNEADAINAFNKQAAVFDEIYSGNPIISYKRERVRQHVMHYLPPGSSILELNCGTGEDAVFFAQQGYRVHATDLSAGMQQIVRQKAETYPELISFETCSYTQLNQLKQRGPYDMVFSNFGGLNCTDQLPQVLASLADLLKPGGMMTLVIIPGFCLWEILLVFKGKFRTAFRRFFSRNGRIAHIEGVYFKCWYYHPSFIIQQLRYSFGVLSVEGLCTLVPPSYIEGFAEKYPKVWHFLKKKEDQFKSSWPWKYTGDYYILSLIKK